MRATSGGYAGGIVLVLAMLAAAPAFAGATQWQEIALGARLRLISSDRIENGTLLAGVEIDLPPGVNSYWRVPGETGLPTEVDLGSSTDIGAAEILFPYPEIDQSRGYLDYVYKGNLVLPLRIATDGPAVTLNVKITLGVCSDVCVPAEASFSLPVGAAPDAAQQTRLQIALARVPIAWDQPAPPFADIALSADDAALELGGVDPAIDPASLIVDVGDPAILFQTPQKSRDGTIWIVTPLRRSDLSGLEGRPVELTFSTAMGPYAVGAKIAAGAP